MRRKQLLKFLDDTNRALGKLGKVAFTLYRLVLLAYKLYKIIAHL
jgi:hypothetical protein